MTIADDDITGVAAGADFFISAAILAASCFSTASTREGMRAISRACTGAGAEIAVQLRIQLVIGVGADTGQQQAGEGHRHRNSLI